VIATATIVAKSGLQKLNNQPGIFSAVLRIPYQANSQVWIYPVAAIGYKVLQEEVLYLFWGTGLPKIHQ
jgi:hypothetical protein